MSGDSSEENSAGVRSIKTEVAQNSQTETVQGHAVFRLSPDGSVASWSDIAAEMYGYDTDEVVGNSFTTLLSDSETETGDVVELLGTAEEAPLVAEQWHERADGSRFWTTCTIAPLGSTTEFRGYRVVSQDTTARYEYTRKLELQNERLEEFTDVLAHELRNPLSVITSHLEFYWRNGEDEHVEKIEITAERMNRLINDLLQVARNGRFVTNPEPVDLESLIDTAAEGTMPASATVESETVPDVLADHDRLCELLENLFRNAVEHGADTVTVRVGPHEDGFFVEDDGPGIPQADRSEIFDHGFSTQTEGTGIGLSIVRTIAGAHGWTVAVTDGSDGGARFEITGVEFADR